MIAIALAIIALVILAYLAIPCPHKRHAWEDVDYREDYEDAWSD